MSQEWLTLRAGTLVEARGDRWKIVEMVDHGTCASCRMVGAATSNIGLRRTLLVPFDRPRPVESRTRPRRVGRHRWMFALRSLLAASSTLAGLRGAACARLDLHGYQLEPALACARGASRLLLADEVGLGKTVQAGLILADLSARAESVRALVLCPAGLCGQWCHELEDRFGLRPDLVDLATLRRLLQHSSPDVGPWDRLGIAVASIDFVKQPDILQGMGHIRWDLLVVDEAHLCAVAPERAAAVNWLARRSRRVALLTATPHPGEAGAFEALCRIGRLPGEGPLLMFRRTRASLGLPVSRHARVLAVRLSPGERRMHALLERYTTRVWEASSAGGSRANARLAMIVLRKRASSGAAPLLASLARRLRWLAAPDTAATSQLLLPFDGDGEHEAADEEPGAVLAAPGLPDAAAERQVLERLVELAGAAVEHDSKCRALVRFLRRAGEPAVVFTEYRDTLSHLADLFAPAGGVAMIHGGMDRASRADAVRAFTRGTSRLLLATDAAAHGLNLQARCRLVINLELPWNPLRLEQRVGRVDRIGQQRAVHAVHLLARGTSEAKVLERLTMRVERIRQVMGETADLLGRVTEAEVAESVFEPNAVLSRRKPAGRRVVETSSPRCDTESPSELVSRSNLAEEAEAEAARLRCVRQLARPGELVLQGVLARLDRTGPWWTTLRVRREWRAPDAGREVVLRNRMLALFRADVVDGRGLLLDQFLLALSIGLQGRDSVDGAAMRRLCESGSTVMAALQAEAGRQAAERLAGLRTLVIPRLEAQRAREIAVALVSDRVPAVAFQPGLFDRRALRADEEDRRARNLQEEETKRMLSALGRATDLSLAGAPRLVLAAVGR